jgi:hypothetical protein
MSKKDDAAMAAVLQYFVHQNRPYSAQDVFMNLHKDHSKAVVQKVIDQLVEQQDLREKVNGKQKCYVANQVRIAFECIRGGGSSIYQVPSIPLHE